MGRVLTAVLMGTIGLTLVSGCGTTMVAVSHQNHNASSQSQAAMAKAVPLTLILHLQNLPPTASANAVWQNRETGNVGGFPLSWATNTKRHPDTYTYRTRLVPGDYRLGVYESGVPTGAVVSLRVPPGGGKVNLRLRPLPFQAGVIHKTAVTGAVIGPDGKPARSGLVLALPVGAGNLLQAATRTSKGGRFRLPLPSQGVYDLFAVEPGTGGVGAAAVGTLTGRTAHADLRIPSWQGRRYVVVLQQGLAYSGKPVWVWGRLPGQAPHLGLEALPGSPPLLSVHLQAKDGLFVWSGVFRPGQEDLTATYTIGQGKVPVAAFTLPGVPTGTNGNETWPENIAPYHLAWGSVTEGGDKVRLNIGGYLINGPWGLWPLPDGQVPVPVAIGSPWSQTVARMPLAIPSQPLLSVYNVEGGPLVPPKNSWLGGFRLSAG